MSKLCRSFVKVVSKFCQTCLKIVSLIQGRTKWPGKKFTSNLLVIVRELVHESLLVTSIRWCDQCDINGRPLCQLPPILKHIQIYKSRGARSFGRYIYMCLIAWNQILKVRSGASSASKSLMTHIFYCSIWRHWHLATTYYNISKFHQYLFLEFEFGITLK